MVGERAVSVVTVRVRGVKQVVQVRLEADAAQLDVLARTLTACNGTANLVSSIAHRERVFRGRDLRAITYAQARAHAGLAPRWPSHVFARSPTPTPR